MTVSVEHNNAKNQIRKGEKLPYYRGYIVNITIENKSYKCDFFNSVNNSPNIELISMQHPNNQGLSLPELLLIANLFPMLKKKYYEQSDLTIFEYKGSSPIIAKITEQENQYIFCFVIIGGEYSRRPGSLISLIDYKSILIMGNGKN